MTLSPNLAADKTIQTLLSDDDGERYAASRTLSKRGANAIPLLIEALAQDAPRLRAMAAHALAGMETKAAGALPTLIELLTKDPDATVRASAVRAVSLIASGDGLPALTRAMEDADTNVAITAAFGVSRLDPTSTRAAERLAEALARPEPKGTNQRQEACFFLEKMGAAAAPAIPALINMLSGAEDEDLTASAIETLGKLGPVARPAISVLRDVEGDSSPHLMRLAREALNKIQGLR
jgi:HEAT repeat protein